MLFCLVHGAWHDEACWQPLVDELGHRGHECVVPVLPLDDDRASFDDYAEVVADRLRGRELPVLVGHSMSSAVIPLVAVKRPARLLVYLCPAMGGFPPPRGEPPWRRAGYDSPPRGCDRSQFVAARSRDRPALQTHGAATRRAARRPAASPAAIPCSNGPYPLGAPRPMFRRRSSTRARMSCSMTAGRAGSRTHSSASSRSRACPGGHFPMLERPATLADVLETVSGDQRSRTNLAAEARP